MGWGTGFSPLYNQPLWLLNSTPLGNSSKVANLHIQDVADIYNNYDYLYRNPDSGEFETGVADGVLNPLERDIAKRWLMLQSNALYGDPNLVFRATNQLAALEYVDSMAGLNSVGPEAFAPYVRDFGVQDCGVQSFDTQGEATGTSSCWPPVGDT